jgi:hypothetical protein
VTKSVQLSSWQTPAQTRLMQSLPVPQLSPVSQSGHAPPPQSTSVSVPLSTPSVHVAGWQAPERQWLLWQSDPTKHAAKSAQGEQVGPPQSTSVSPPFRTPSVHSGVWHVVEQKPVVQSACTLHGWPTPQGGQPPPQSTPVSAPFLTRSVHVG